jgi:hypothetical protein
LPRTHSEASCALDQPTIGEPTSETGSFSRIAQLQLENARLRKLVTYLLLEKMRLEEDQPELRVSANKNKSAN